MKYLISIGHAGSVSLGASFDRVICLNTCSLYSAHFALDEAPPSFYIPVESHSTRMQVVIYCHVIIMWFFLLSVQCAVGGGIGSDHYKVEARFPRIARLGTHSRFFDPSHKPAPVV